MTKLIFENLTLKQAITFANWYEGQGEQYADIWFEENGLETPITDVGRKGGYMKVDHENDIVTVYLRTPK
jgi:hypothetical protein